MAKNNLGILLFLAVITFAAYGNSLNNGFVWDDKVYILESEVVKKGDLFLQVFSAPARFPHLAENTDLSRPLMALSLLIDHSLWGEKPFGYHLTNVVIHLFNSILLYFLALSLFQRRILGIAAAGLFALHPVHTEAINVITFREDLLATFFYLLSFLFCLAGRERSNKARLIFYLMTLLSYGAALLSKEMAITLPLLLLSLFWFESEKRRDNRSLRRYSGVILFLTAALSLIYLYFLYSVYASLPPSFYSGYPAGSLYNSLLTLPVIVVYYVKLLLLPVTLLADYSFPVVSSLRALPFAGALLLLISMGVCARLRGRREFFLLSWFFISLLPVANLIPTFNMMAERFLYLPSVSFVLLMASIIVGAPHRSRGWVRSFLPVVLIGIFFLLLSVLRNGAWRDDRSIWSDTLRKNSASFIAQSNMGSVFRGEGNHVAALSAYRKALALEPNNAKVHYNLGLLHVDAGLYEKALHEFIMARRLDPENGHYALNVGGIYGILGEHERAVEVFREVLQRDPDNSLARTNLLIAEKALARAREKR